MAFAAFLTERLSSIAKYQRQKAAIEKAAFCVIGEVKASCYVNR